MTREYFLYCLADLRCLFVLPKRYKTPIGKPLSYWMDVSRRYGNMMKKLDGCDYRWHIISYDDGRRELAYLRVLQDGFFSGACPSIYKGMVIPRRIGYGTFSHIKDIRLAF